MISELANGLLVVRHKGGKLSNLNKGDSQTFLSIHRGAQERLLQKLNKDVKSRDIAFDRVVNLLRESYPPPSKIMVPESQT